MSVFRRHASLEAVDNDLKIVRIACPAQRYNNNKSMENMLSNKIKRFGLTFVATGRRTQYRSRMNKWDRTEVNLRLMDGESLWKTYNRRLIVYGIENSLNQNLESRPISSRARAHSLLSQMADHPTELLR